MKKIMIGLLVLIMQQVGFSQSENRLITVANDIELIKISDNAFIHISYIMNSKWGRIGSNGILFIDHKKAFLFDTPWTNEQTETLIAWVNDSMNLEIIGFIPNHWHNDCMGGLEFILKQNIDSYANQMTIDRAKIEKLPTPKHGFTDSLELKLGDKLIKCYYLGVAHSTDNTVVWIPSEKLLFPACMVKNMSARNLGNTKDGDINAYPKTLAKLIKKFPLAKIVIPGHGTHGGLELVEHTMELTNNK